MDQAIRDLFLAGVSTRRVGEIAQALFDDAVSATTVSRLCKALDKQVRAFHTRPLEDDLVYLYLDGLSMKVKRPDGVRKRILLVALGISAGGKKYMVDFRLVRRETKEHWHALLENLYLRGLQRAQLACITTDGKPGLIGALQIVYRRVLTGAGPPAPVRPPGAAEVGAAVSMREARDYARTSLAAGPATAEQAESSPRTALPRAARRTPTSATPRFLAGRAR